MVVLPLTARYAASNEGTHHCSYPGRLLDLMERKTVSLSTIHNVVMDEADEMLNMDSQKASTPFWLMYRRSATPYCFPQQ